MKIRIFYADGTEDRAHGRRAKSLLRRELRGTGFSLCDILSIKRGETLVLADDAENPKTGIMLRCFAQQPERGLDRLVDCFDFSSGCRWDRFAVSVKS